MPRIHQLKEQRAALHEQQKALLTNENGFSAEDEAKFDEIDADIEAIGEEIQKIESRQKQVAERDKAFGKADSKTQDFLNDKNRRKQEEAEGELLDLFADFDLGNRSESLNEVANSGANRALRAEYDNWLATGIEGNLRHTNQGEGGALVMPEQYIARLIQNVDDMVYIRSLATIISLKSSRSIGAPTRDTDADDAEWTSELDTGSDDEGLTFGKRKMTPSPLAKRIRVSRDLLRINEINAEAIVRQRLAYKFGVAQENGFMTGSGSNQPLGLFTASTDGISTSRDVSTGNTSSAITADGLIEAKYSLKPQYMMSSSLRWIFHRSAIKNIRKLRYTDGDEHFVWKPGLKDQSDTILEVPFIMSEFAPSTFTTGLYVGMIGDFSNYWIVEVLQYELQRLVELYAASNQVGFIGRSWVDGAPVLEEAFARVKLA